MKHPRWKQHQLVTNHHHSLVLCIFKTISIELVAPLSGARSQSLEASQVKTVSIIVNHHLHQPPVLCVPKSIVNQYWVGSFIIQSMEASQVKTASISERTPPEPPPLTLPPVLCVCSSTNTSTTSALGSTISVSSSPPSNYFLPTQHLTIIWMLKYHVQ